MPEPKRPRPSGSHSFRVDDAVEHGPITAVLLSHLEFHIRNHMAVGRNAFGGTTYNYNSVPSLHEQYPYLSEKQIRSRLEKLVSDGVLVTGTYSENPFDRTLWYGFADEQARFGFVTESYDDGEEPEPDPEEPPEEGAIEPPSVCPPGQIDVDPEGGCTSDLGGRSTYSSDFSSETSISPPEAATPGEPPREDDDLAREAAGALFNILIEAGSPHAVKAREQGQTQKTLEAWASEFERLHRIDNHSWEDVREVLTWLRERDDFWIPNGNLQSAVKLRRKDRDGVSYFNVLLARARHTPKRSGGTSAKPLDLDAYRNA